MNEKKRKSLYKCIKNGLLIKIIFIVCDILTTMPILYDYLNVIYLSIILHVKIVNPKCGA